MVSGLVLGYVISFTIAAALIFISWVFLSLTRERPVLEHPDSIGDDKTLNVRLQVLVAEANVGRSPSVETRLKEIAQVVEGEHTLEGYARESG